MVNNSNATRKIILPDLGESYYNFYQYLQNTLKTQYESPNNKDDDRRKVIEDVFKKCYIVQKYIIEDLWESCNNAPASNKQMTMTSDQQPLKKVYKIINHKINIPQVEQARVRFAHVNKQITCNM